MEKLTRRGFLTGLASALCASSAHARPLHGAASAVSLPPILQGSTLTPTSFFTTAYSGRGPISTLPALDRSVRGDGTYAAQVIARVDCWDRRIIEAGQTLVVTNVCGNGDLSTDQVVETIFSIGTGSPAGTAGSFVSVAQSTVGQSALTGAVGHQVTIQAPTQPNDSWAELVIDTIPTRGVPNREIIRLHFKGTNYSGALRPAVYVSNSVGSDSSTNPTSPSTPYRSIMKAKLYAAVNGIDLVYADETTGVNPITLTSHDSSGNVIRSLSFGTVYLENYSLFNNAALGANYASGSFSNVTPVELKPLHGGRLAISRSFAAFVDSGGHRQFGWSCARTVDFNVDWLMSSPAGSCLINNFSNSVNSGTGNNNINRYFLSFNCNRYDLSADNDVYTGIYGQYADTMFSDGIDSPDTLSYLGDINCTSTCTNANGANFVFNSTYAQCGNDMFSTTDTNQGSTIVSGFSGDQSRWYYDRYHVSETLPVASVIQDSYNELTTINIAPEQFPGYATVSISGSGTSQIATITTYADSQYQQPMPHNFRIRYASGSPGVKNVFFPSGGPGPLAGLKPTTGEPGFAVTAVGSSSYSNSTFTINVAGLGLTNTTTPQKAGTFTYNSIYSNLLNTASGYDEVLFIRSNAANPSNVFQFQANDWHFTEYRNPSYSGVGALPSVSTGVLEWLTSQCGYGGETVAIHTGDSVGGPIPTLFNTPRVTISGTTLTARGFLNGGLNSGGAVAASPAVATQDAPAPSTTITTSTNSSGQTLVQCNGALPPAALFYWGCTIYVGSQKLKVAANINFSASTAAATVAPGSTGAGGVAAGQPGYSFYATPVSSNWTDVTTPTAWSFADNMHGVFPNTQILFGAVGSGTVVNVLSVSGETISVDAAPGDTTTPTRFTLFPGTQVACIFCRDLYHDPFGVPTAPRVQGLAAGDTIQYGARSHPDAFQMQNGGITTPRCHPVINGLIQDRAIYKGKSLQSTICGFGGSAYYGVGTVNVDSNGYPTFVPGTMVVGVAPATTAQAYACLSGPSGTAGGNYPLDFINTPSGAAAYNQLKLYQVVFYSSNVSFPSLTNGWGNIRIYFESGALQNKSLRLWAHTMTSGNAGSNGQLQSGAAAGSTSLSVTNVATSSHTSGTITYNANDYISILGDPNTYKVAAAASIAFGATGTVTLVSPLQQAAAANVFITLFGGTMTAYLQDDLGVVPASGLPLVVGDTAVQPVNMTDGCVMAIGNQNGATATASNEAQAAVVTFNPANPTQPTVSKPFTRFAGQTGLPWVTPQNVHRVLWRSYTYMNYAVLNAHGVNGGANPLGQIGTNFAWSDFNCIQSTILGSAAGSCSMRFAWNGNVRSRYLDTIICGNVGMQSLADGSQVGFDDSVYDNCITGGLQYVTSNNYGSQATLAGSFTAQTPGDNLSGYITELDAATAKPNAVYTGANALDPLGTARIPKLVAPRYPYRLDGTLVNVGEYIGALQPLGV